MPTGNRSTQAAQCAASASASHHPITFAIRIVACLPILNDGDANLRSIPPWQGPDRDPVQWNVPHFVTVILLR